MFSAVESSTNYSYISSASAYKKNFGRGTVSYWWYRFPVYSQTYTDYQKIFQYKKVTQKESTNEVTSVANISNVQKYVKYRKK